MQKKIIIGFITSLLALSVANISLATLTTIGTAQFGGTGAEYKLIWDDDNNGNSVVWLDYRNTTYESWGYHVNWAIGLNSSLSYNIDPSYSVDWGDNSWRLPATLDGLKGYGYEGDPDNDGIYSYSSGHNLANSEMGHLFYVELGNLGERDFFGNHRGSFGLVNRGDFDNLSQFWYWSGTELDGGINDQVWVFDMSMGKQYADFKNPQYPSNHSIAVRTGQVSTVPLPGGIWILSSGFVWLIVTKRRSKLLL